MCDSEAEKILFILNKHERAYRRLIPVYIFLAIVLWILPILLIVYLYFCIVDNEFLRIGFCIAWTAYYFLGTVAKLAMRQPFVLFKGLTFQKLCLPGAFRPGDHHNKMLRPGLCVVHASPQYL